MAQKKRYFVRGLTWIVVIAGLAALGVWYLGRSDEEVPEYRTAPVTRGALIQAVTATGQLNPMLNVQVGSQISGIIQKLFADFNSRVKSGQVIAQLDPATYRANVHQAEGELANAKAGLELAQVNANRTAQLFNSQLISQSDNDKTIADLHQAEAQVKIKEAALERSKVDLDRCTIYAPVDGIVISRNVDVGQTVAASMNAPVLFLIANDLSKMQIDAAVSEADVGTIEEGQTGNFTVDAFPGRTFEGKVTQIRNSPITVQNVVTYDTIIEVSNPDLKLKPGMTANISVTTAQRENVLKIPNSALRFKPPEHSTNQTLMARLAAKVGLGKKTVSPNSSRATSSGTNKVAAGTNAEPPLTGNEPPEELMRRLRDMRDRGEEAPPEIRNKLRELFQSGALRPAGGGERGSRRGGGGTRSPAGQTSSHTVYMLVTNTPAAGGDAVPVPKAVKVKTGISDGSYTEITDGLKEGEVIITSVKLPPPQAAAPPAGTSPFGGGGGRRGP